jgi:hypothetical protein
MAILAQHEEVMLFIENHSLMGKGLGYRFCCKTPSDWIYKENTY